MTKSLINYLTYKIKNCSRSVEAHFLNRAGSVSLSLSPIQVAYTSFIIVCNQLPLSLPKMPDQILLTLHWLSFWGWGRGCISLVFDYKGSKYIQKRQWRTNLNIMQLAVGYQNATMNRNPKNQNQRLEPTGLAKLGKTTRLEGTDPRFVCREAVGQVDGWVSNGTNLDFGPNPEHWQVTQTRCKQ